MIEYSNVRYLLAKRPIDDRAINREVIARLEQELKLRPSDARPLRVLELGAGVGTMVSRLIDWGVVSGAEYTLVDRDVESLAAAREHLAVWGNVSATSERLHIERARSERGPIRGGPTHGSPAHRSPAVIDVDFVARDLLAFLAAPEARRRYDLIVANAVLDLFDLGPTLPVIWKALEPGGLFWFTINFDGETIFLPELPLDAAVMHAYHATMAADAAGTRAGHSQTGRRLLQAVPASGARLTAAGSSDWVVFPEGGGYPGDEAYFLHHIVQTIWTALEGNTELRGAGFEAWARARHEQIERAELCYIAHQLDVLGRSPR